MAEPQSGWYPDPAGNEAKLRYWDGTQWTENFMDNPNYTPSEVIEVEGEVIESSQGAGAAGDAGAAAAGAAAGAAGAAGAAAAGAAGATGAATQQPYGQQTQQTQQPYSQQQYGQQPQYGQVPPTYQQAQPIQVELTQHTYPMTDTDRTLRLIAFVFALVDTVLMAFFLIPLAWMIPMTVHMWRIYKGKRANTIAFGVCTLLFVSMISGILLLISNKDR